MDPEFTPYYLELARLAPEEAEPLLRRAVDIKPCEEMPRVRLASYLRGKARHAAGLAVLEAGFERCPEALAFINEVAYALATGPIDSLRDGPRALILANRVVEATRGKQPSYLDTLASAYAEVGEYDRAVEASRRAIGLLEQRGVSKRVLASFQRNLERFEARQPVREP